MLDNYMETLENCRFCLMCRHVAPVGLVTDLETLTPHGIAWIATSQQRGLSEEDAINLIVNGYCKEVFNELPMEFAVEAQKLLAVSLEGSVG